MHACRYVEENGLAAMVLHLEVNLREYVTRMPLPRANKAAHFGFETRGDITRSPKQGYQWPHKKDLCPPKKIFLKKNKVQMSMV